MGGLNWPSRDILRGPSSVLLLISPVQLGHATQVQQPLRALEGQAAFSHWQLPILFLSKTGIIHHFLWHSKHPKSFEMLLLLLV